MLYEKESNFNCQQIRNKANDFFGEKHGLEINSEGDNCLSFEGSGGYVSITCCPDEQKEKVTAEIETREWDYQAKQFLKMI